MNGAARRIQLGPRAKSTGWGGILQGRNPMKLLVYVAAVFSAALVAACLLVPRGLALTAICDLCDSVLLLVAILAFALNGRSTKGRLRWFWLLQAAGWGLWFADQMFWNVFDLILKQKPPEMYPADALLFLTGAPMIAGLLLRPHRQPSEKNARLGFLDFLLLLLWWLYLYVSFVVCWQYPAPNEALYSRNFDLLSAAETIVLSAILVLFFRECSGPWKRFYAVFCGAAVFNGIAFYIINRGLESGTYYTGNWHDIPYGLSFGLFILVPFYGQQLTSKAEAAGDEAYNSWMASLAMVAVLSLPIIGLSATLNPRMPHAASDFRAVVTLGTMFLMALILFTQHRRLNLELKRTNAVLEEASLTDPLTGLRNRRYFSATIDADVSQALRSHSDHHDPHTRDLVFYLIDADNFKEVNDQYGHDIGDKVLVEMARRLSSSIRHSDVLVRWGGEEFLIVSRYTDRREAEWLAQRVLSAVADTPFALPGSDQTISRTCSVGWAAFPWFLDDPRAVGYEEVLTVADRGLHRAKESGKNCAVGMLPASGKVPATTVAGLHSTALQVDVLAISGPHSGA